MKKIFFCTIAAALFACPLFHSISATAQTPDHSEEIELTTEKRTDTKSEGRSISTIEAYYHPETSLVEVIAVGVGTCTVSLRNASGYIISQTIITPYNICAYLAVPATLGTYEIIIESRNYYSYGYFTNR